MDHTLKQGKYTASVFITLAFVSIVVVSFVDSITCPMILQLATEGSLAASLEDVGSKGGGDGTTVQSFVDRASLHRSAQAIDAKRAVLKANIFQREGYNMTDAALAAAIPYEEGSEVYGGLGAYDDDAVTAEANNRKSSSGKRQKMKAFVTGKTVDPSPLSSGTQQRPKLQMSALMAKFLKSPRSVFDEAYYYFPCNITDLLLQIYAVWFLVFMFHKWIVYKKEGMHYFMLDYCYFHNMLMIFMLLSGIVSIDVHDGSVNSSDGQAMSRNHHYMAINAEAKYTMEGENNANGEGRSASAPNVYTVDSLPGYWEVAFGLVTEGFQNTVSLQQARYYLGDPLRAVVPSLTYKLMSLFEEGRSKDSSALSTAFQLDAVLAPFSSVPTMFASSPTNNDFTFKPTVTIRVAPSRFALSAIPPLSQVRFVVMFIMFLGGTFGPILGAIVMWHNALLFHSFDKMTACYLHLAPALVQIVILSVAYESSDMVKHLQSIFAAATEGLEGSAKPQMPSVMRQYREFGHVGDLSSTSSAHTIGGGILDSKAIFNHYFTIPNLILSHVAFFLVWQVFYHITFSLMAVRRERQFAKKMRAEGKLLKSLSDCGTNPTARVTAYTWMMANPPGGKKGLNYRIVCVFGEGATPTKIMFSVMQLAFHVVYISASLPVLYFALKVREEPSWLLGYLSIFMMLAVWNAGGVLKHWISKLQKAADAAKVREMELAEQYATSSQQGTSEGSSSPSPNLSTPSDDETAVGEEGSSPANK